MVLDIVTDFLETSTIHGLVHISLAKSKVARFAWVAIVVACFGVAIHMITSSYKDWEESPVSTTITTHPITELEFPTVTVCPPRGSNTALNHLLRVVKDLNFTEQERQQLLGISQEVFIEIPNEEYTKPMTKILSTKNMRSIAIGQASMPERDTKGMITVRSFESKGSFSSSLIEDQRDFHFVLDLPENINEMMGEGELVISVETSHGSWSFISPDNKWQLYPVVKTWDAAEDFCVSKGGH